MHIREDKNIPVCKNVKLIACEIPNHFKGTYSSMYRATITPIIPIEMPTMNLAIRKTIKFWMKVKREAPIPIKQEIIKAFARPWTIKELAAPEPKIVPNAGIVFINDSLRSFWACVSQPYLASKSGIQRLNVNSIVKEFSFSRQSYWQAWRWTSPSGRDWCFSCWDRAWPHWHLRPFDLLSLSFWALMRSLPSSNLLKPASPLSAPATFASKLFVALKSQFRVEKQL